MVLYKFILLGIMLFFSGFFSMTETAFLSLSKIRIHHLVEMKKKNALLVQNLKDDIHRLIIAILIGNNLVNISASAIATSIALMYSQSWGVSIATGLMTLVVLIFGEVTPKSFAMMHAEKICLKTAKFMRVLKVLLHPIILFLDLLASSITKRDNHDNGPDITQEELKSIINMGEEAGSIEKEEKEMIQNIFKLDDINVGEVMTPRTDMFTMNGDIKIFEALKEIVSRKYSRIPIYQGNTDNIVGIVHIRDILISITENRIGATLNDIMQDVLFIPDVKKIDDVLTEFQNKKVQMAIVIDEHGGVAGLVSIEDLIEEIVGEIYDEKDEREQLVKRLNGNTYLVKGAARIDEVNDAIKAKFKETDLYDTISGMILDKLERIPEVGESIVVKDYTLTVTQATKKRILEIKIVKEK